MVENGQEHGEERRRFPVKYGKLRSELDTTLVLSIAAKLPGMIVGGIKTPGDTYRDAPIDADPDVVAKFPDRTCSSRIQLCSPSLSSRS